MKTLLEQFFRASFFFLALNAGLLSYAKADGDRVGTGGSYSQANILSAKIEIENIANQIIDFFTLNSELQENFPEFSLAELTELKHVYRVQVLDQATVEDDQGVERTCRNFRSSGLIECAYGEFSTARENPAGLYVLVFHELLGLLGVEETSINSNYIEHGYNISSRLAPYVVRSSGYRLSRRIAPMVQVFNEEEIEFEGRKLIGYERRSADRFCQIQGFARASDYSTRRYHVTVLDYLHYASRRISYRANERRGNRARRRSGNRLYKISENLARLSYTIGHPRTRIFSSIACEGRL